MEAKRDLFICATYWHALIATIKAFSAVKKPDVLLTDESLDAQKLAFALSESGLFDSVTVFPERAAKIYSDWRIPYVSHGTELDLTQLPLKRLLADHFIIKKCAKHFQFQNYITRSYRDIYAFNDAVILTAYMRSRRIAYRILEDGVDHYKRLFYYLNFSYEKTLREKLLAPLFEIHYGHGKSRYQKSVEVNDAQGIVPIPPHKVCVLNKAELYAGLAPDLKRVITRIFTTGYDFSIPDGKDCALLLTQPFAVDYRLSSLGLQMRLFRELVQTHCQGLTVIIKPHPRDVAEEEYRKAFAGEDVVVMAKNIPVEVLMFMEGVRFRKVVSTSPSITQLNYEGEMVVLDNAWFDDWKRRNIIE